MTTSQQLERVASRWERFVAGKQLQVLLAQALHGGPIAPHAITTQVVTGADHTAHGRLGLSAQAPTFIGPVMLTQGADQPPEP